jgi:Fe2+ or Zn2+ uptake regulation protein
VEPSQLRRAGLKITAPRLKILEILASTTVRHMSA